MTQIVNNQQYNVSLLPGGFSILFRLPGLGAGQSHVVSYIQLNVGNVLPP